MTSAFKWVLHSTNSSNSTYIQYYYYPIGNKTTDFYSKALIDIADDKHYKGLFSGYNFKTINNFSVANDNYTTINDGMVGAKYKKHIYYTPPNLNTTDTAFFIAEHQGIKYYLYRDKVFSTRPRPNGIRYASPNVETGSKLAYERNAWSYSIIPTLGRRKYKQTAYPQGNNISILDAKSRVEKADLYRKITNNVIGDVYSTIKPYNYNYENETYEATNNYLWITEYGGTKTKLQLLNTFPVGSSWGSVLVTGISIPASYIGKFCRIQVHEDYNENNGGWCGGAMQGIEIYQEYNDLSEEVPFDIPTDTNEFIPALYTPET